VYLSKEVKEVVMCSVEVIMCSVEVITCSVEANNVIVEGQLKVLNSKSTNNEQSDPLKTKEKEINKNKRNAVRGIFITITGGNRKLTLNVSRQCPFVLLVRYVEGNVEIWKVKKKLG